MTILKLPRGMTVSEVRARLAINRRSLEQRQAKLRKILREASTELVEVDRRLKDVDDSIIALNGG
jgi:hypothetical protein